MIVQPKISPEEYLVREANAPTKSEYHNGEIVAMAGAGPAHNIIVANLIAALHTCLRKSGCLVLPSDMKVYAPGCENYYYPDVIIVCGKMEFHTHRNDYLLNPSVIIEVLSPGTEAYDRGAKFTCYRSIPTCQEYVLVSSEQLLVERYRKETANHWNFVFTDQRTDTIPIQQCPIALADIYENVAFTTA